MRRSQAHAPAAGRRGPADSRSVTTAVGIAAERRALATRARERQTALARSAARGLAQRSLDR
jgi:hypothetical protein